MILDNQLKFHQHIEEKTKAGFRALKGLDSFINGNGSKGCSQSIFMHLYKALVLPLMDFGAAVLVSAITECSKEMGKVQRAAMLASGCLSSTSTDALEVLTNTLPLDLHLKMRQAQEMVRIGAKHDIDPLKKDFNNWATSSRGNFSRPTIFQLLMCRFKEVKGSVVFDNIEKEFQYSRDIMGLTKTKGKVNIEEFKVGKEIQTENIKELLARLPPEDVIVFTDGSALENPGPTGAGWVVYLDGYHSSPVLLKKGVSKHSNNYTGELVGIQICLDFLAELDQITNRKIHFFTDCQSAIVSAFHNQMPTNKIEISLAIKKLISQITEKGNEIHAHWVPSQKDIQGNELADQQAKAAAHEMITSKEAFDISLDKKEVITQIRHEIAEKWLRKFTLSDKMDSIQDTFSRVGKRSCYGERDRASFSALNQLLCGHSILNAHMAKINSSVSEMCSSCNVPETLEHFLFDCGSFSEERSVLERTVQDILIKEDIFCSVIDLRILAGYIETITKESSTELVSALLKFIQCTKRFVL